jgi:CHASE3 domain sensor protein
VAIFPLGKQIYVNEYRRANNKMDNPEKLTTLATQDEDKQNKTKTQHNMCWTPLYEKQTQIT